MKSKEKSTSAERRTPKSGAKVSERAGDALVPIFLELPPEHIVSLKFVLESYEGIGVVRTLDPLRGEAVVLALEDTKEIAHNIISSVAGELSIRFIPAPQSMAGDWLLSEVEADGAKS